MDDWTVGAFSDSIEEKVKKLNLYRIPELPKDTFIKPRKRAEYWPPHMVPSNQLQKAQQEAIMNVNNNSVAIPTTHNHKNSSEVNNITLTAVSNENVNDFIMVELVI